MSAPLSEAPPGSPEERQVRTVADLMSRDVVTVSPDASLRAFARLLHLNRISGAPVVDEAGRVVGMASVSDLAWLSDLIAGEGPGSGAPGGTPDWDTRTVHEIMTPDVFGVGPDADLAQLGRFFGRTGLHRALVMEDRQLVGIVSVVDLLGWVANGGESEP